METISSTVTAKWQGVKEIRLTFPSTSSWHQMMAVIALQCQTTIPVMLKSLGTTLKQQKITSTAKTLQIPQTHLHRCPRLDMASERERRQELWKRQGVGQVCLQLARRQ